LLGHRKPEAGPSDEPPRLKNFASAVDVCVAPLVLVFGGNAARGAVMSTDNAYLQADMVGLSTACPESSRK